MFVAGSRVPSGRDNCLVIRDLSVFDHHPVGERAAGRFVKTDAVKFLVAELGLHENFGIARCNVLHEQIPVLIRKVRQHCGTNRSCRDAPQRGMQHDRGDLFLRDGGDPVNGFSSPLMSELMPLRITNQDLGQRTDLHGAAFEARRFDPSVFAIVLEAGVMRVRFALPGVERALPFIPGVRYVFRDALMSAGRYDS